MNNSPIKNNKKHDNKVIYELKCDESKSFALDVGNSEIINLNGVKLSNSDINISTLGPESLIVVYIDKEYKEGWLDKRNNENKINKDKVRKEEELQQTYAEEENKIHERYRTQYVHSDDGDNRYKQELEDNTSSLNRELENYRKYYDQLLDRNSSIATVSAPSPTLHYYTYRISDEEKNKKIFEHNTFPLDFLEPAVIKITQIRDNHGSIQFKCGCNKFQKEIDLTNTFLKPDGSSIDYTQYLNKNFRIIPGDNILNEIYSLDIYEYDERSGETGEKIGTFPIHFLAVKDNNINLFYWHDLNKISYHPIQFFTLEKDKDNSISGYASDGDGNAIDLQGTIKSDKFKIPFNHNIFDEVLSIFKVQSDETNSKEAEQGTEATQIQIKSEVDSAKTSVEKVKQDVEESRSSSLQAKETISQFKSEAESIVSKIKEHENQAQVAKVNAESAKQKAEEVRDSAIQIKSEVDSAKTSVEKVKQDVEESRSSSLQAKETISQFKSEAESIVSKIKEHENQAQVAKVNAESAKQKAEEVRDSAIQIKSEVDSAKTSVEKVKQDVEESRSSSLKAKEEAVKARDDIIEIMEILKQCKTDAIKYVDQILLKKKESEAISGELREIKLCHKNPESQYYLTREKREMNQLQQEHYGEDIDNDQSNFSEVGLI